MSYTLLLEKYNEYSIFRILDEVTSCIESIKEKLMTKGFDESKLELAIGGYSSGAHIAVLYGYSMKNIPLCYIHHNFLIHSSVDGHIVVSMS